MSPSRTRKPVAHLRPRSEVVIAVISGASIVVGTALLVWLLRPGKVGSSGTGGLFSRQPRVVILVVLAGIVFFALGTWLVRGRRRPRRLGTRGAISVAAAVVIVAAAVGGFFWPGGLVHHWPPQPKVETTPTVPPTNLPTTPPTTRPSATTKPSTTKPSTATTVAATTTTKGK